MLSGVRVVAVADPLAECRRGRRGAFSRRGDSCRAWRAAGNSALDGVLVASPPSTHLDVWRAATARGIAAFVEKPLVLASELDALDGRDSDRRVMVDFNRRFWPPYLRLCALVRDGALGRPVHVEFSLSLDVLGWSQITRHRLDDREGGVLHDLGCHAIDLSTQLTGEAPGSDRSRDGEPPLAGRSCAAPAPVPERRVGCVRARHTAHARASGWRCGGPSRPPGSSSPTRRFTWSPPRGRRAGSWRRSPTRRSSATEPSAARSRSGGPACAVRLPHSKPRCAVVRRFSPGWTTARGTRATWRPPFVRQQAAASRRPSDAGPVRIALRPRSYRLNGRRVQKGGHPLRRRLAVGPGPDLKHPIVFLLEEEARSQDFPPCRARNGDRSGS